MTDEPPAIWSNGPYVDEDGDIRDAAIEIFLPFAKRPRNELERMEISLSVDEADHFARRLWQMVQDARQGRYTPKSEDEALPPPPPL